ncbi:MAG: hypothetical protein NC833_02530 [Candidatus Omnitrophica bacterium]|nr:hypothetical protein [Candidatus Omnitrophota bacterium]
MKKSIITIYSIILIFGTFQIKLIAQEEKFKNLPNKDIKFSRAILKDAMETRKRMKEIEGQTIENDPELKLLAEEIISLRKKMREKINEKLKDNEEYQNLKKKLKEIWSEWNKKRKEVEK